jgi:hypothetical protein
MSNITTAKIKEYLNQKYSIQSWKRATKRKFQYNNLHLKTEENEFIKLNGYLNWRVFIGDIRVFVIDDGENILYSEQFSAGLPPSIFDVGVYECEESDTIGFFVVPKEKYENIFSHSISLFPDNLRDSDIAGLFYAFKEKGLYIEDIQENMFAVYNEYNSDNEHWTKNMNQSNYLTEDNMSDIKNILINELKMTYSEEISEDPYSY